MPTVEAPNLVNTRAELTRSPEETEPYTTIFLDPSIRGSCSREPERRR